MPRGEAKIFECVECSREYSKQDAQKGRYFPSTRVCRQCYKKMVKADRKIWCFGKKATRKLSGYSPENEVCNSLCPDKNICLYFIHRNKGE